LLKLIERYTLQSSKDEIKSYGSLLITGRAMNRERNREGGSAFLRVNVEADSKPSDYCYSVAGGVE
jgi:hypothetical protein